MSRPASGSGSARVPSSGSPAAAAPRSFWFPGALRRIFGIRQVPVEESLEAGTVSGYHLSREVAEHPLGEDVVPDKALDQRRQQRIVGRPHGLPVVALRGQGPQGRGRVTGDRQVPGLVMAVDDAVGAAVADHGPVVQAERRLADTEDVDAHAAPIGRGNLLGQRIQVGAVTGYVYPLASAADEVVCRVDDGYPRVGFLVQPKLVLLGVLAPHPRDFQLDRGQALA